MTMSAKEAAKVLREESARIEKHGYIMCSGPTAQTVKQAIDAAAAALEGLNDPAAVLANMMRGQIANPHAETAARCDALAAENDRLRERLEGMAGVTNRARELIGLHTSEQEGMMPPTAAQFTDAVDALAQAIGAADQHPRERALSEDAARGNFRAT